MNINSLSELLRSFNRKSTNKILNLKQKHIFFFFNQLCCVSLLPYYKKE